MTELPASTKNLPKGLEAYEKFPQLSIAGFEKLPPERQNLYLQIPGDKLDLARPIIEEEIVKIAESRERDEAATQRNGEGHNDVVQGTTHRVQANQAIETFHRAEQGDPEAKKDLLDQKRELLNEEPSDDDISQTILESQSSNPFAQDLTLEVMLSDEEAQAHQDVLDLFKEFKGDLASVDDALKPKQQIELFLELTKGGDSLPNRMFFARKALTVLTANSQRNLSVGLKELHVLESGELSEDGIRKFKELTVSSEVIPSHA